MHVLVNDDVYGVDRCMIDDLCHFVPRSSATSVELPYVTLFKDYFAVYTSRYNGIPFDYKCRNVVMVYLYQGREDLIKGDGNELPYFIFTNIHSIFRKVEHNTIIQSYDEIDLAAFASIVKNRRCLRDFFVVYLDYEEYLCCNTETLETYRYNITMMDTVIPLLRENVNNMTKLREREERQSPKEHLIASPLVGCSSFLFLSKDGNSVKDKGNYYLRMQSKNGVVRANNNILYAQKSTQNDHFIVKCSVIDGIYYLMHDDKYIQSDEIDLSLNSTIPKKSQRLRFHMTSFNTFAITGWNNSTCLRMYMTSPRYASLWFDSHHEAIPLYLFLTIII